MCWKKNDKLRIAWILVRLKIVYLQPTLSFVSLNSTLVASEHLDIQKRYIFTATFVMFKIIESYRKTD